MPIKIPADLPACHALESENIFIMTDERANKQDIRPLEIVIVNLMPTKIATETQLLRLLGNSPLQVNITFLRTAEHISKNTPRSHLDRFYCTFEQIKERNFDGMIITGAPVELLPFEEVDYWQELSTIMNYAEHNVHSTLYICWAAQAGLYHYYGIPKNNLKSKISGIFEQQITHNSCRLFRGFDDVFCMPHSRNTEVLRSHIESEPDLKIVAESREAGVSVVKTKHGRKIFITGHLEYDKDTLDAEYRRDLAKGIQPNIPENYYQYNNPSWSPIVRWRAHAHLFFCNWLNYYVYQETPFNLDNGI